MDEVLNTNDAILACRSKSNVYFTDMGSQGEFISTNWKNMQDPVYLTTLALLTSKRIEKFFPTTGVLYTNTSDLCQVIMQVYQAEVNTSHQ